MQFLYVLESIRAGWLDTVMSLVTQLGGETVFMALAVAVYWCVSKRHGYFMLTVGFAGTLLNQLLKLTFRIPRPWVRDPSFTIVESAREAAGGYSFPSGHTQNVVSTFGCAARGTKNRAIRAVSIVIIVLVAFSRMYLGVHTPLDVGVSLVLGTALVFGIWPLFDKCYKNKPRIMYITLGAMLLCSAAYLLIVELARWPADIDAQNLAEGVKNGWTILGAVPGMALGYWLDDKFIHFEVKAPPVFQLLKCVLGLGLLLGLRVALKAPLNTMFCGHSAANAVRYFVLTAFASGVWPLTFGWFAARCPMRRVLRIIVIIFIIIALLLGVGYFICTADSKDAPEESNSSENSLITPLGETLLSAHRAGGGEAPENTLRAIKNCVENEAFEVDILEFDLHMTLDGCLVLLHDPTLDRTSDAAERFGRENVTVAECTFLELKQLNMGEHFTLPDGSAPYAGLRGEKVPDDLRVTGLEEVLQYLNGVKRFNFIIEIKDAGERGFAAADELYRLLKKYDCLSRAVVGTFHNEVTEYLDEAYPDMLRSAGVKEVVKFYFCSLLGLRVDEKAFEFTALQIPTDDYVFNLGTTRLVNYAHKYNIAVQYWTINDPGEMLYLRSIGADAILTDDPAAAYEALFLKPRSP